MDRIASKMEIEAVLIGWNLEKTTYQEVGKLLKEKGIKMLLRLKVTII